MQDLGDVAHARKVLEKGDKVEQLVVVRVVEPRHNGDGVVRVEQVRRRAVVHDNRLGKQT